MSEQQEKAAVKAEYAHKSKIGGQALVEGVMMKGALKGAMACRLPDGSIDVETWDLKGAGKNKPWYRKIPLIRGCYSFIFSMADDYRCLMKSAEKQMTEEELQQENEKEESKFVEILMMIGMVLGVAISLALFLYSKNL